MWRQNESTTYPFTPFYPCFVENSSALSIFIRFLTADRCLVVREEVVDITPAPFAGQIGVIRRGDQADCFRRAGVEIAKVVGPLLNFVRAKVVLVVNDYVVRRPDLALKTVVSLKVEVEVEASKAW